MTKTASIILLALLCSVISACSVRPEFSQTAPSSSSDFRLTEAELAETRLRADDGDVGSMRKLYFHYSYYAGEEQAGMSWLERAAESGDADSRSSILDLYLGSKFPDLRAKGEALREKWGATDKPKP